MSLQLWLPLTKDLRQQGLSGITPTQTTGYTKITAGKIGECYKFTSTFDTLLPLSNWNWTEHSVSFGCWAKISQSELATLVNAASYDATYNSMGGTLLGRDSYGGIGLRWKTNNIYSTSALSAVYIYIHMRNTSSSSNNTSQYTIPFDTWFHVMTVIDRTENKIKVYINGELFTSTNLTVTGTFNTGTFRIAESTWDGGNGRSSAGCWQLNDVRVYDHALTQTEIKELAKGLVLHYPLNDKYIENTTNLVTGLTAGGQTIIDGTTVKTKGESNADTYFHIKTSALTSGTTYTLSCHVSGLADGKFWSFGIGAQSGNNKCCSFILYNGYNSCTFTLPSGLANATQLIWDDDNYSIARATTVMVVSNIQLEQKDHATGIIPFGTSRNNSIVYDCSGLCNNGTCTGTFTLANDSARYDTSTIFTAEPNAISSVTNFSHLTTFTYNCWIKTNTAHNAFVLMGYQYGNNTSGSLALDSGTSKAGFHYYVHAGGQGDVTIGSNVNYYDNQWHMLTATYDGSKIITYFDGVKTAEGSVSLLTSSRTFSLNQPSGASGRYFKGQMSDARVYATVLSAEDVLELYHTAARIDNVGNTYVYQYIET